MTKEQWEKALKAIARKTYEECVYRHWHEQCLQYRIGPIRICGKPPTPSPTPVDEGAC